jgi:hypothetical protein
MELYLDGENCFVFVNELLYHCLLFDTNLLIESFEVEANKKPQEYSEDEYEENY